MNGSDAAFFGSIPDTYDRYFVPMLFEPYAPDLAERVANLISGVSRGLVLETAAERLSSSRVTWRQADALSLPFEDSSFDAVACQFGVMFFPDRVGGYAEAIRVLKPGGHFVFNVWDRIERNELAHAVATATAVLFPDDPPTFLERTPYGSHDVNLIGAELRMRGSMTSRLKASRSPAPPPLPATQLRDSVGARPC